MKIAICIHQSTLGGVGTSTYILATGLRAAGHQADILVTDKEAGADYERARGEGWPVEAICVGQLWMRERLRTVLGRLSTYDVVINNNSQETRLVLPALPARGLRLAVVRSTDPAVIRDASWQAPYLDALVGISPAVTDLLVKQGVRCDLHTIPNAVLVENEVLPALTRPVRIAYVGRLEDRAKHILLLPEVVDRLRRCMPDFELVIAGDGPDRRRLERRIAALGVGSHVALRGAMPREAAWRLLCGTHFVLMPSRFEGFGLVLAESMAAGAVPVARDIPAFRWILGEDADALLVPGESPAGYVERLVGLVLDAERYQKLQRRLQERQRACFSPSGTVAGYRAVVESLAEGGCRGGHEPVSIGNLPLPWCSRLRCSRVWYGLQRLKQALRGGAACVWNV